MRGESWSLSLRFSEWPGWGRSAGSGSGTRPSLKSQERSVALLQTMPGSELTSSPFLLQSALCLRAWRDWPEQLAGTQQDVLLDRLCLAFPETESFPNPVIPSLRVLSKTVCSQNPPPFLRSRSPKMAPSCPVVQQHDRPLSYWETPPKSCPLHSLTASQLPTQVPIHPPIVKY